jgi:hypothetical protein
VNSYTVMVKFTLHGPSRAAVLRDLTRLLVLAESNPAVLSTERGPVGRNP